MFAAESYLWEGHRRIAVPDIFWHNAVVKTPFLNAPESSVPVFLILLSGLACLRASAAGELPLLATVRQVREISPEQAAQGYPVRLRGVVTYCNAWADVGMFVQDATASVYVKLGEGTNLNAGDDVEVQGITAPGDYVPMVLAEHLRVLGQSPLPAPGRMSYEQLATGKEDSQWVEVQGVVRSVVPGSKNRTRLDLMLNGERLSALVGHLDVAKAEELIGANIRLQGVCRTRFNRKRQLRAPYLSVTSPSNIVVEVAAPGEIAEVPLASLLQFNSEGYYGRRVKVQGVVTHQKENSLFIQDGRASLYVRTAQTNPVSPGDVVQVVGFPVLGQYAPMLEDAIFHVVGHKAEPTPAEVRIDQLSPGDYDTVLVRLRGRLINRIERADEQILVLEAQNLILNAHLNSSKAERRFTALQNGSELELTGVCLAQPVENWNPSLEYAPEAFQLLLRDSADVAVIQNPPWWTLSRLLWMLGMMSVVLLAGFAWVFALDRKVRQQTTIIQQKLQREAVLEERTRIAREFHDTLEQELAAITIQLETVSAQFDQSPRVARQMLELARNMTRRSLFEARRSVWDLRSHLLENSNLVTALAEVAKLTPRSPRVQIAVQTSGTPRKLPPQMENNLLRVAQEALANALKHAQATRIAVNLDYQPAKVSLRVTDDGVGFDTANPSVNQNSGHFGLLDMSERAEKMGGRYAMISAPGQGTEIRVEVPEKGEPGSSADAAAELEMRAAG
jgi:signal transduction histidine kinase